MIRGLKAAVLLLAVGLVLCSCAARFKPGAPMSSFRFSHSGMSTGSIYELSAYRSGDGWKAGISLLGGEAEYCFEITEEDVDSLAALVDEHELTRWNGFDRADRRVQDGSAFELRIDYGDEQALRASGSNAFPKGYRAAHDEIRRFFGELMEENGLENPF